MAEFIETPFQEAGKFLEALRPNHDTWSTGLTPAQDWASGWIFRGESSTVLWTPLVPAIWRENNRTGEFARQRTLIWMRDEFISAIQTCFSKQSFPESSDPSVITRKSSILDAYAELTLVDQFIELADELGLPVKRRPRKSTFDFVSDYAYIYFGQGALPSPPLIQDPQAQPNRMNQRYDLWSNEAIALAQHHGVTTRLLDWTRNSLYAAYFAATEVKDSKSYDYIAVYALHVEMLPPDIRVVRVPSGENDFYRAQAGLFTVDLKADEDRLLTGNYPSLIDALKRSSGFDPVYPFAIWPKKLTLPVSETPELLRLLWKERVTEAHLMPTLDHVASAIKKRGEIMKVIAAGSREDR